MPTYMLTSPDGKKYKVSGEGSGQDALAHLQSQLSGQPAKPQVATGEGRYAAEDAAQEQSSRDANVFQQFGRGVKAQAGRFALGAAELGNNLTGDRLIDPEVLATAQRGADVMDKGTGTAGFVGNVAGDPLTWALAGVGGAGIKGAKTLGQAVKAGAKAGAITGGISGAMQSTGNVESDIGTNLGNAAIGVGLGGAMGGAVPLAAAGVKGGAKAIKGGVQRVASGFGSDEASQSIAYRTLAKVLNEQGSSPAEVASIIDQFKAQGIDGVTIGQMLQSPDLLLREKNLLQTGGKAGKYMADKYREQPEKVSSALIKKAKEIYQPEQTSSLYTAAGEFADVEKLPFTLDSLQDALADDADYLPSAVSKRIQRYIERTKKVGTFEAYDRLKQDLAEEYTDKATSMLSPNEKATNKMVNGYRQMLNASLEEAGGDTYGLAKQSAKRDMAARDAIVAFDTTGTGRIKTALNKFYGSPEKKSEFLEKLPNKALRDEFEKLLDNIEKVATRPNGSDTASNQATQAVMNTEMGLGFSPNIISPRNTLQKLGDPINRNVRKAAANISFNPNVDRLSDAIKRQSYQPSVVGRATPILTNEATKATIGSERNALQIPSRAEQGKAPVSVDMQPMSYKAFEPVELKRPESSLFQRIAQAESGGNPNAKAKNSSASGLYQFTNDTWNAGVQRWGKELGVSHKDKNNPEAQEAMMGKLVESNSQYIQSKLGIEPNGGQIYLAHFMGAPAAVKLMKNYGTGASAAQLFPKAAKANQSIFFNKGKPRSVEDVYAVITNKVGV